MTLGHFGLTVADLERSVGFYRDVAGFVDDHRSELASPAFARLTGADPIPSIHVAFLSLGGVVLQLIEYVAGGADAQLELAHNRVGSPHIQITVQDVRQRHSELRASLGVAAVPDLVEILPGAWSFYVEDPDGVPVELIQYPPATGRASTSPTGD